MSKVTALREHSTTEASTLQQDKTQKSKRFILLVVVPASVLIGAAFIYMLGGGSVATDNAYVKADMVPVSTEVSGTVKEVLVAENQSVSAGEILYRLDSEPFTVAVSQAEAHLALIRTELAALQASYQEKQAEIILAQKKYDFALKDQQRLSNLAENKLISNSQFDDAAHNSDIAKQEIEVQVKDLQRIAASLGGSAETPVEQHPGYLSALAQLQQAQLNLARVDVRASLDGNVSKPPRVGQYIAAGNAAMSLITNNNLWIEANFTETDLTYVQAGQAVTIHIDTYPNKVWHGEVDSLSPATLAEFSILPAQNATGNWVKIAQRVPVKIRFALDGAQQLPRLRAGLSSEVEIKTGHQRSLFGLTL